MNCLLCCFNCLGFIGCRDCLLKKVAFFPPEKYELEKDGIFHHVYGQIETYKFSKLYPLQQDDLEKILGNTIKYHILLLTPNKNTKIPVMYIQNKQKKNYQKANQKKSKQIILYSHGNSTDLFHIRESLIEISYELQIDIIAYDYQGYGLKNKSTTDLNIIQSIESVYEFVTQTLQYEWYNIIVYGQSLGSGPSTFLASNYYTPVFGLILQSPIASGLRVINPGLQNLQKQDLFPNYAMIKFVKCPIFVMHGDNDKEVHIMNGRLIFENAFNKSYMPWWVNTANHHDISYKFRQDFYMKLVNFIDYINAVKNKVGVEYLLKQFQAENWDREFKHIYNTKKFRPKAYGKKESKNKYLYKQHDLSIQKSIQMQESKNNNYSNLQYQKQNQSQQSISIQQTNNHKVSRNLSSNRLTDKKLDI